jgi:hypothetical protein
MQDEEAKLMNSFNEESCAKYYLEGQIFSPQTSSFNVQLFGQQLNSPTSILKVPHSYASQKAGGYPQ